MSDIPNNTPQKGRVELPAVVSADTNKHFSAILIEDGIAQVEDHMKTIEAGVKEVNEQAQKLNERMQVLNSRRISLQAQTSLLKELKAKLDDFNHANAQAS
jgi:hypothetical protein